MTLLYSKQDLSDVEKTFISPMSKLTLRPTVKKQRGDITPAPISPQTEHSQSDEPFLYLPKASDDDDVMITN